MRCYWHVCMYVCTDAQTRLNNQSKGCFVSNSKRSAGMNCTMPRADWISRSLSSIHPVILHFILKANKQNTYTHTYTQLVIKRVQSYRVTMKKQTNIDNKEQIPDCICNHRYINSSSSTVTLTYMHCAGRGGRPASTSDRSPAAEPRSVFQRRRSRPKASAPR